ncbi:MAG: methionine adenosyltransferase [Candidatus Micrarchaeaceae archaeon]
MRNISISRHTHPIYKRDIEFVERKGIGHPDSLIDGIVDATSHELSKEYLNSTGSILHHNVDKGLIIGGSSEVSFGAGKITRKIEVIVTGRATEQFGGRFFDVNEIARNTAKSYLKGVTRFLDLENDVTIVSKIAKGSSDLQHIFMRSNGVPLANDTSFGMGFAPLSETERLVLETERYLNSPSYKSKMPMVGEDVKVMGLREGDKITLTVAIAFVSKFINNIDEYVAAKERVKADILSFKNGITDKETEVFINTGDAIEHSSVYLTKTGLSCESGDDGSVGRGNRVNGLITPFRIMSLEAAAGKNPVNHVGKIYNILASLLAKRVVSEYSDIEECDVGILSQIGKPISEPKSITIEIAGENFESQRGKIRYIADSMLENINNLIEEIAIGKYPTF